MLQLEGWAQTEGLTLVCKLNLESLDQFYALHTVARATRVREIQTLRSFFAFCIKRNWCSDNPASQIEMPKGLKPNEVVPYTLEKLQQS